MPARIVQSLDFEGHRLFRCPSQDLGEGCILRSKLDEDLPSQDATNFIFRDADVPQDVIVGRSSFRLVPGRLKVSHDSPVVTSQYPLLCCLRKCIFRSNS